MFERVYSVTTGSGNNGEGPGGRRDAGRALEAAAPQACDHGEALADRRAPPPPGGAGRRSCLPLSSPAQGRLDNGSAALLQLCQPSSWVGPITRACGCRPLTPLWPPPPADWMRSKLLQAVGLSTRWRPEQPPDDKAEGGGEAAAAAATAENGRAKRARRIPAALQGTIYGEQAEEGSPVRPVSTAPAPKRSRGGTSTSGAGRAAGAGSATPGGSAGGGTTASDGGAATGGATSVTQGPPMVVVVVSDPQVPAWPSFMPLAPAAAPRGGAPFVQAEGGRWQLLPDQLASQLAAQEQARAQAAQLNQQAAAQRASEQLAERQALQQQELAERHAREQQQLAAQQSLEQHALAERHAREQHEQHAQHAQHAHHAQHAQQQLTAQQLQQAAATAAQLAALRPLAVEDVLVPREQPGGVDAQQAMWSVLQSAGIVPSWLTGGAQLPPAPQLPPPPALPASAGVWVGGGAAAGQPARSVSAHAVGPPRSQFPSSAASPAASVGGPKPSPFAAEAAVPLPTAREPDASELEQVAKHPLASLLQGDLSLMGLAALAEEGGFGLSSMLPTPSADLHKLFGAWQEGRVSLSLSRRDMPGLASATFGAHQALEPAHKAALPPQGLPAPQERQP